MERGKTNDLMGEGADMGNMETSTVIKNDC